MSLMCPKCNNGDRFTITATIEVLVKNNDDEPEIESYDPDTIEWESRSLVECLLCKFTGELDEFEISD